MAERGKQVKGMLKTLKQKGRNLARKGKGNTYSRAKMVNWYKHHIRKGRRRKSDKRVKTDRAKIDAGRKMEKMVIARPVIGRRKGNL